MVGLVSTLAGAGISALSSVIAAAKSGKKNTKAQKIIDEQRQSNKDWYNSVKAEDYTKRADSQAVITKQRDLLNEQYKNAAAANVVSGGSEESLAMQKEAANKAAADTMSNIAAQGASYKENAEQQYRNTENALAQQKAQAYQNEANNIAEAGGQAASAGLNLMNAGLKQWDEGDTAALKNIFKKKETTGNTTEQS